LEVQQYGLTRELWYALYFLGWGKRVVLPLSQETQLEFLFFLLQPLHIFLFQYVYEFYFLLLSENLKFQKPPELYYMTNLFL